MPKAIKPVKVPTLDVNVILENEKNVSEAFLLTFTNTGLCVEHNSSPDKITISKDFLPEFIAALQTTYPDAFALIEKHQKATKTNK
jgi:hypothetical protein